MKWDIECRNILEITKTLQQMRKKRNSGLPLEATLTLASFHISQAVSKIDAYMIKKYDLTSAMQGFTKRNSKLG
jgi:hypothetical protein